MSDIVNFKGKKITKHEKAIIETIESEINTELNPVLNLL